MKKHGMIDKLQFGIHSQFKTDSDSQIRFGGWN